MLEKIKNFTLAHTEWVKSGMPTRSPERVIDIYDNICTKCEHFSNDRCGICGCAIKRDRVLFNKLAMATTRCPLEEPKWIEEEGHSGAVLTPEETEELKNLEIQPETVIEESATPTPPRSVPKGCGCR